MPSERVTRILLNAIHFSGGASLANASLRGEGSILMLHRTQPARKRGFQPNAHLCVTPGFLDQMLDQLTRSIFEFVSLDEAVARIRRVAAGEKSRRPFVAVTLDDGYRDNLEHAVPLFRKYKVPYTIYIAPGLVDGRSTLWWEDLERLLASRQRLDFDMPDGRVEIPLRTPGEKQDAFSFLVKYLTTKVSEEEQRRIILQLCALHGIDCEAHRAASIMNWRELTELAEDPLCSLGAHTIHHYAVARLSEKEAAFEIAESRRLIELETGRLPVHFAYPYGYPAAAGQRDFDICRDQGFVSAVTTRHGVCYAAHADHLTALPRISLNGNFQKQKYVKTMLSGATTRLSNRGAKLNIG